MDFDYKRTQNFTISDLLEIMKLLRGEGGCPWDRAQDHHTIRKNFIEETYEAVEAIDREDAELLREELGDVLLQVVFHAEIEREAGTFSFEDVCDSICRKLIFRHPFLFEDADREDDRTPDEHWDERKQKEKGFSSGAEYLDSVSKTLPALMRAQKLVSRSQKKGLSQRNAGSLQAIRGCLDRLDSAAAAGDEERKTRLGELLFEISRYAERNGLEAEVALSHKNDRFIREFAAFEQQMTAECGAVEQCSMEGTAVPERAVTTQEF